MLIYASNYMHMIRTMHASGNYDNSHTQQSIKSDMKQPDNKQIESDHLLTLPTNLH